MFCREDERQPPKPTNLNTYIMIFLILILIVFIAVITLMVIDDKSKAHGVTLTILSVFLALLFPCLLIVMYIYR